MRYDRAFSIGSAIEGTIKCTWAEVFDAEDNKLFSLQNRNFSRKTVIPDGNTRFDGSIQTEEHNYFMTGDTYLLNLAWTNAEVFEAVVTATKYVYAYKVPVTLTAGAIATISMFIRTKIAIQEEKVNGWKQTVELLEKAHAGTEDVLILAKIAEAKRMYSHYASGLQHLQNKLAFFTSGKEVYVKPKAFDWHPLNTNSIVADYSAALAEYEKAKRIMAVSAASIII